MLDLVKTNALLTVAMIRIVSLISQDPCKLAEIVVGGIMSPIFTSNIQVAMTDFLTPSLVDDEREAVSIAAIKLLVVSLTLLSTVDNAVLLVSVSPSVADLIIAAAVAAAAACRSSSGGGLANSQASQVSLEASLIRVHLGQAHSIGGNSEAAAAMAATAAGGRGAAVEDGSLPCSSAKQDSQISQALFLWHSMQL